MGLRVLTLVLLIGVVGSLWRSPAQAFSTRLIQRELDPRVSYWRQVEHILREESEADFVVEAVSTHDLRITKPWAVVPPKATTTEDLLRLFPADEGARRGLAVLIIPDSESVQGTGKIMDEVILDVRDVLLSRGFRRFVVAARSHGLPVQIYADGLPTRTEVENKKRLWQEIEERSRNKKDSGQ